MAAVGTLVAGALVVDFAADRMAAHMAAVGTLVAGPLVVDFAVDRMT